jgi:sugar (pentulose or hexulose) kinase
MAYLGIDLGTGGVRCLLVEADGKIVKETACELQHLNVATEAHHSEQEPRDWITALETAMDELFADAAHRHVQAIAVDSTSGTVLPVSDDGVALGRALLYNDMRAGVEADECAAVFGGACSPTYGLPKILWMQRHLSLEDNCLYFHAADYLNSWLAGSVEVPTDFTNAMKTGVDLEKEEWSRALPDLRLPELVAPGKKFGVLREDLRHRWHLSGELGLVSGATDSNAAFYASGAAVAGDWSSTLGTTLAVKGLSDTRLEDPDARIYCHKHPDGTWLPGGASNAGGEILRVRFASRMAELESAAAGRGRTARVLYPSVRVGERLPFACGSFTPFDEGAQGDQVDEFIACLEGLACVEALVFELLEKLGGVVGETIYATGGAAGSLLGLQIRADFLQKVFAVPAHPNSVMGAAILAAAGDEGRPVGELSRRMTTITHRIEPLARESAYHHDRLHQFRELCARELAKWP